MSSPSKEEEKPSHRGQIESPRLAALARDHLRLHPSPPRHDATPISLRTSSTNSLSTLGRPEVTLQVGNRRLACPISSRHRRVAVGAPRRRVAVFVWLARSRPSTRDLAPPNAASPTVASGTDDRRLARSTEADVADWRTRSNSTERLSAGSCTPDGVGSTPRPTRRFGWSTPSDASWRRPTTFH